MKPSFLECPVSSRVWHARQSLAGTCLVSADESEGARPLNSARPMEQMMRIFVLYLALREDWQHEHGPRKWRYTGQRSGFGQKFYATLGSNSSAASARIGVTAQDVGQPGDSIEFVKETRDT